MKKYSLSGEERIKKKKDFEKLYNSSNTLVSSNQTIKAIYLFEKSSGQPSVKIATAISKKAGTSVWRNRAKRLIKESYRLNKTMLVQKSEEKKFDVLVVFTANHLSEKKNKKVNFIEISESIKDLITKLTNQISKKTANQDK